MQAELDLLKEKGTWELVEKLPDAILLQINGYSSRSVTRKEKLSGTEQDSWPKDAHNILDTIMWRHFHLLSEWTHYAQF